jgi:hypothetical protein
MNASQNRRLWMLHPLVTGVAGFVLGGCLVGFCWSTSTPKAVSVAVTPAIEQAATDLSAMQAAKSVSPAAFAATSWERVVFPKHGPEAQKSIDDGKLTVMRLLKKDPREWSTSTAIRDGIDDVGSVGLYAWGFVGDLPWQAAKDAGPQVNAYIIKQAELHAGQKQWQTQPARFGFMEVKLFCLQTDKSQSMQVDFRLAD